MRPAPDDPDRISGRTSVPDLRAILESIPDDCAVSASPWLGQLDIHGPPGSGGARERWGYILLGESSIVRLGEESQRCHWTGTTPGSSTRRS